MKIKKGDKVVVLVGRDRNKTGVVERVFTKTGEVLVSGINKVKKHVKVSKQFPAGGIVDQERPMDISKVQIVCASCGKKTRVGYETKGTEKVRVCKKCQKPLTEKKAKESK